MIQETTITVKKKKSNIHFYIDGAYNTETAMSVAGDISRSYKGKGNVFIHTGEITDISVHAKEMFESLVQILQLPVKSIYFNGEKGFQLCHNGGRVIIMNRKKSCKRKQNSCNGCEE